MPNLENIHFKPLYVKDRDEDYIMPQKMAVEKVESNNSNNYRLPTIDELHIMYRNKEKIPALQLGFDDRYWASLFSNIDLTLPIGNVFAFNFNENIKTQQFIIGITGAFARLVRN